MRLAVVLAISFLAAGFGAAGFAGTQGSPLGQPPAPDVALKSSEAHAPSAATDVVPPAPAKPRPDLTGRKRVGVASFYADMFAGRQMADGNRMDPKGTNAASRTLPLGTTAKVTNIETGKSAIVTIQDRAPRHKGRGPGWSRWRSCRFRCW